MIALILPSRRSRDPVPNFTASNSRLSHPATTPTIPLAQTAYARVMPRSAGAGGLGAIFRMGIGSANAGSRMNFSTFGSPAINFAGDSSGTAGSPFVGYNLALLGETIYGRWWDFIGTWTGGLDVSTVNLQAWVDNRRIVQAYGTTGSGTGTPTGGSLSSVVVVGNSDANNRSFDGLIPVFARWNRVLSYAEQFLVQKHGPFAVPAGLITALINGRDYGPYRLPFSDAGGVAPRASTVRSPQERLHLLGPRSSRLFSLPATTSQARPLILPSRAGAQAATRKLGKPLMLFTGDNRGIGAYTAPVAQSGTKFRAGRRGRALYANAYTDQAGLAYGTVPSANLPQRGWTIVLVADAPKAGAYASLSYPGYLYGGTLDDFSGGFLLSLEVQDGTNGMHLAVRAGTDVSWINSADGSTTSTHDAALVSAQSFVAVASYDRVTLRFWIRYIGGTSHGLLRQWASSRTAGWHANPIVMNVGTYRRSGGWRSLRENIYLAGVFEGAADRALTQQLIDDPWQVARKPRSSRFLLAPSGAPLLDTLRPIADVSAGTWNSAPGVGAPLYAMLNEASANDTNYIFTESTSDVCEIAFEAGASSVGGTAIVRYRIKGGVTVTLKQGATVVQSWTHDPGPSVETTFEQTASGVTDASDLRLRFTSLT